MRASMSAALEDLRLALAWPMPQPPMPVLQVLVLPVLVLPMPVFPARIWPEPVLLQPALPRGLVPFSGRKPSVAAVPSCVPERVCLLLRTA